MSLAAGTKIGPYEIQSPLGSGGMGEVYRARDPRLGRDVAIKVLPVAFSADVERLSRFEQEARAAAALNHPNILAVHDIGQHNGSPYIVSELLEGETLRERLQGAPAASHLAARTTSEQSALPVRKAVEYAIQVARGLAAAHEKGIVHRDLKPENVFVTNDGRVKILDFGLAKLTQAEALRPAEAGRYVPDGGVRLQADLSALPTAPPDTLPGVVLGTIGYMSPEQVRGLAADHRSDIFAFGAILYEMLSGRRAFRGETTIDAMTAILKEDPPDLPSSQRQIPPAVTRIVDRCLEKNPAARFKSADDLAFALEALSAHSGAAEAVVGPSPRAVTRERVAWTLLTVAVLAVAVAVAIPYFRTPATAPEMRVEINTPATSDPISFAVSPDGRRLVFVASGDGQPRLWLRPLDAVTAQPLAGTEGATYPFWSPDSRSVGFFAGGKLRRVDIGGGLPQTIADANPGRGGTWNSDGVILFASATGTPLFRVPASGGETRAVTKLDAPRSVAHRFPQFLPGGQQFLFYAQGTPEVQGIYLASLDSSETKRLTPADTAGAYAPPGWLLFVRQGTLVARRFELSRGELVGDPVTVAEQIGTDPTYGLGAFSVSAAGLVIYRAGGESRRQLTWFDRSGKVLGTLGAPDENGLLSPELSPDGRRVAVHRTVQGNTDVWLLDALRTTRFTFDASIDRFPVWSPDGSQIVFSSNRKGAFDLYRKPSTGAGAEELLVESSLLKSPFIWSPDGRFLLYGVANDPKTGYDLWVLPLEGDRPSTGSGRPEPAEGRKPFVFLNTSFEERTGQFSPDGRWVAYVSNESGRHEIYVRPFPGRSSAGTVDARAGGQWQVSTAGGIQPRWRLDGRELYYIAPDAKLMAAPIAINGTTLEPGAPVALFQTRIWGGGVDTYNREQYDVAPDGRFLINVTTDEATASPITVILNWAAGVNK